MRSRLILFRPDILYLRQILCYSLVRCTIVDKTAYRINGKLPYLMDVFLREYTFCTHLNSVFKSYGGKDKQFIYHLCSSSNYS